VVDPVCGMTLDTSTAHTADINGHTLYFCSVDCRDSFTGKHGAANTTSSRRPHP
jgi:YHS domain-containing protein